MAEKEASMAIENAEQKLDQEADILQEVRKLKSLRSGLRSMSKQLKEFEGQEYEPEVAETLHQVRDIAYETQDKIDSIAVDSMYQKQRSKVGRLLGRRRSIKQHLEEITEIENRIQGLPSFKQVGGSFKECQPLAAFSKTQEALRNQLISGGLERDVILIFGNAGLGKTSIAKMVYNNDDVKQCFSCQVWVYWPQELALGELLGRILENINPSTQNDGKMDDAKLMDDAELMDEVSKSLKGKKYLIVIDNLPNSELSGDDMIMSSFPDDSNGSRILLTSRVKPGDLQMKCRFSHEVEPLDRSQSWELLSRKVFSDGEDIPSNLNNLGEELAVRCKGSPRAITVLANMLKDAEKTEDVWKKFVDSDEDGQILDHRDLPMELSLCFLYFGIFPPDFDIPAKQVIQMWVAEGFLKPKGSKKAEDIGEGYLKELLERGFIEVADSKEKKYRISGTAYQHCTTECTAAKILEVTRNGDSEPQKGMKRLGIHVPDKSIQVLKSFENCCHQLTLQYFYKDTDAINIDSARLWKALRNFSHLRVLNLGFMNLDRVPKVLGELICLTYIRLKAPNVTHLPSSVGNLHNLETLDMRETHLRGRLHGIWKMKRLRHIYLGNFTVPDPHGIDYYQALQDLQTLSGVHTDKILKRVMVRAKFPNVTKLRACSLDKEVAFKFLNSLDHLCHLRSLRVENPTKLPDPTAFPLSLTKLTLKETKLHEDCINKTLEKLSNLKTLKLLKESITGKEIACSAGGFLHLQVLWLENLVLEKWTQGEQEMQCLEQFNAKECHNLDTIPEKFRLKQRIVEDCPKLLNNP